MVRKSKTLLTHRVSSYQCYSVDTADCVELLDCSSIISNHQNASGEVKQIESIGYAAGNNLTHNERGNTLTTAITVAFSFSIYRFGEKFLRIL